VASRLPRPRQLGSVADDVSPGRGEVSQQKSHPGGFQACCSRAAPQKLLSPKPLGCCHPAVTAACSSSGSGRPTTRPRCLSRGPGEGGCASHGSDRTGRVSWPDPPGSHTCTAVAVPTHAEGSRAARQEPAPGRC